jgi:hypothetical protein
MYQLYLYRYHAGTRARASAGLYCLINGSKAKQMVLVFFTRVLYLQIVETHFVLSILSIWYQYRIDIV